MLAFQLIFYFCDISCLQNAYITVLSELLLFLVPGFTVNWYINFKYVDFKFNSLIKTNKCIYDINDDFQILAYNYN